MSPIDRDLTDLHYQRTVENFDLFDTESLHFLGYFQNDDDDIFTALRQLNEFFARAINAQSGEIVLDVGCGTGGLASTLAAFYGCDVVGIDIGRPQIERALNLLNDKLVGQHLRFELQDAAAMSFSDQTFDRIAVLGSASHVADKPSMFAECFRVIKPGGRLVLGDLMILDRERFFNKLNSARARIADHFFGHPDAKSPEQFDELLREAGFDVEQKERLTSHMLRSCGAWARMLDERGQHIDGTLGRGRSRAFQKSVRAIEKLVQGDLFDALVLVARRRAE